MSAAPRLVRQLPLVGVMGSGTEPHAELADPIGEWIARHGCHLLTGGGGGVMSAVARAFTAIAPREGLSIGILPAGPPPGYPNRWVELPIRTHLDALGTDGESARSRNHLNILTSDVVVALPGAAGTASEIRLAARYGRPLIRFESEADPASLETLARAVAAVRAARGAPPI